ncbi:hypothetical protein Tco_1067765 [Tanacetum coccineum]|uniref:Maturase K n=1 Tax=Tanacetum coccineum TaxID=301880 RepID=A0ABQ5HFW4_9ASTR
MGKELERGNFPDSLLRMILQFEVVSKSVLNSRLENSRLQHFEISRFINTPPMLSTSSKVSARIRRIFFAGYGVLRQTHLVLLCWPKYYIRRIVDVDTAYSSKSGNGLLVRQVLDTAYVSRMIRLIGCQNQ